MNVNSSNTKVKAIVALALCLTSSPIYCNTAYAVNPTISNSVEKDNPAWYNDTSFKAKENVEDTRKKTRDMRKKMLDTSLAKYQPSDTLVTPNIDLNATSGANNSNSPTSASTSSSSSSSSSPATPDNKDKMSPHHVTGISSSKLSDAVKKKNAKSSKLKYIKAYEEAEKKYGVNSVFLLALSIQESGWVERSGGVAQQHNNPFSIKKNRTEYVDYASAEACVLDATRQLKQNYLTKGGKFYKGERLEDISNYYVNGGSGPNQAWCDGIRSCMKSLYDALGIK